MSNDPKATPTHSQFPDDPLAGANINLRLPPETQQMHFIYSAHASSKDVAFAKAKLDSILRPELKEQVEVVIWHELGTPVNFPTNLSELKQCHASLTRLKIRLPYVSWDEEFNRPSFSPDATFAFGIICAELASTSAKVYLDAIRSPTRKIALGSSEQESWIELLRSIPQYEHEGWRLAHRVENAPWQAVLHYAKEQHYHQLIPGSLLTRNFEEALQLQARVDYHIFAAVRLRDEALTQEMVRAYDRAKPQIHICIRGAGHEPGVSSILQRASVPVNLHINSEGVTLHPILSETEWLEVLSSDSLPHQIKFELTKRTLVTVSEVLIKSINGFVPEDRTDLTKAVSDIRDPGITERYGRFIKSFRGDLKDLVLGTIAWLSNEEEVRTHPNWAPLVAKLLEMGHFEPGH